MRNSMKLGFLIAVGASFALVQCSGDDDAGTGTPGTGGTQAGAAGSSLTGTSGNTGTSGGNITTGASGSSGTAGNAAGSGGAAGASGGASGSAGTGGAAGATGGSAGSPEAGKPDSAADSATEASTTDASEGGPVTCADESIGASDAGAPDAGTTTTAIVLIDDVVVKNAASTTIDAQWQFDDATTISEPVGGSRPGDKWSRPPYNAIDNDATAKNTFLACGGNPAAGSMKEVVPFTAHDQYYEVSVLFAEHDYSSYHVTAKVKLVTGGRAETTCAAHVHIYAIDASVNDAGMNGETPAAPITLVPGQWQDVTLTFPATGFTRVRELGLRITTYGC